MKYRTSLQKCGFYELQNRMNKMMLNGYSSKMIWRYITMTKRIQKHFKELKKECSNQS